MALPPVTSQDIESALEEFDTSLRNSPEWLNWESNKAQSWVLIHKDQRYPPKKIISLSTGAPVNTFSGGAESNNYLTSRGFNVAPLRVLSLGEIFTSILERYDHFRTSQQFGGHHEIRELFLMAQSILEQSSCVATRPHLRVVYSYGRGNWNTIPWISILDDRETNSTQSGTYAVYLFKAGGGACYLNLAQGVTDVVSQFGADAVEQLKQKALEIREHCSALGEFGFDLNGAPDLGTNRRLAQLYKASTAAVKCYESGNMPSDKGMLKDLDALLGAYDDYVRSTSVTAAAEDIRPLSLIGTKKGIVSHAARINSFIQERGGWADNWSFTIKTAAQSRLVTPFYLYANVGRRRLAAKMRVDAYVTSTGNSGIESPWPEQTEAHWVDLRNIEDRPCKTWFKIGNVEILNPTVKVSDFELAIGLSDARNVNNQNSFGYVIEALGVPGVITPVNNTVIPPLPIDWLVARTGLDAETLLEMVEAVLGDSPQIMLVGPPGTSKTWVARQLALFLTKNRPEQTRFAQFHSNYSYESFIEGLRPTTTTSGISFERTDGLVVEIAKRIRDNDDWNDEDNEYVVLIDEANRANLPRVLGELMFLFEYRDQAVRLQYSEEFSLPKNLRFIATMNTADRSIRSIDVALRRRFDVFELLPNSNILRAYYEQGSNICTISDLVEGFEELNAALEVILDRHHTIGHAFFMREKMDEAALKGIWERKIFPLIEEFFFDQPELTKEFTLERFWSNNDGT